MDIEQRKEAEAMEKIEMGKIMHELDEKERRKNNRLGKAVETNAKEKNKSRQMKEPKKMGGVKKSESSPINLDSDDDDIRIVSSF